MENISLSAYAPMLNIPGTFDTELSGGPGGNTPPPIYSQPTQTTVNIPLMAEPASSPSSFWPRFWGAAKATGGAIETAAGVGVGLVTAWTGIGALAGGAVALHGADTVTAGLRQLISGQETKTLTSQGIGALTGSDTTGEIVDAGIGLIGTAGVGAAAGFARAEQIAEKTITWTRSLPAGSGYTDTFGSMVLSKLGSAVDRAQVLLHEQMHSFLSPGLGDTFAGIRAGLSRFLYSQSSLARYTEEALAESAAQLGTRTMTNSSAILALKTGLEFPIVQGYVTAPRVLTEATGVGAKLASTENQVENAVRDNL